MQAPAGDVTRPAQTQRRELVILWRVTERCNLGCHFCRFSRDVPGARRQVDAARVLRFGRVLGDLGQPVFASWLGGEPLLWPPLFEVSRTLRDQFGLRCGLTTHGGVGAADLWTGLAETFDRITVSVDGDRDFHDQVRQSTGLFDRLAHNLGWATAARSRRGEGPILHVNTVLMRSNLALFGQVCETAAKWGVDELTFNELGGRDRPGQFVDGERLRPEDVAVLREMLLTLRPRMAAAGLSICGSERYLDRMAASAERRRIPVEDCNPGRQFMFVDEQGRVAPCSFTAQEYGVPLRELTSASDLAALPARFAEMRWQRTAPACEDCPSTQVHGKFEYAAV